MKSEKAKKYLVKIGIPNYYESKVIEAIELAENEMRDRSIVAFSGLCEYRYENGNCEFINKPCIELVMICKRLYDFTELISNDKIE